MSQQPHFSPETVFLMSTANQDTLSFLWMGLEEEGGGCMGAGLSVAVWLPWVPFRPSGQLEKGAAEGREW